MLLQQYHKSITHVRRRHGPFHILDLWIQTTGFSESSSDDAASSMCHQLYCTTSSTTANSMKFTQIANHALVGNYYYQLEFSLYTCPVSLTIISNSAKQMPKQFGKSSLIHTSLAFATISTNPPFRKDYDHTLGLL